MNITRQRTIGIIIMAIGIIIGIYALVATLNDLYDLSILIFLIGIVINDLGIYKLLGVYESRYGKIDK